MSPRDVGTTEYRVGQLEERMERNETHVDSLRSWRTFLAGAWLVIAVVGSYAVTFASSSVMSELVQLRRDLAAQKAVR